MSKITHLKTSALLHLKCPNKPQSSGWPPPVWSSVLPPLRPPDTQSFYLSSAQSLTPFPSLHLPQTLPCALRESKVQALATYPETCTPTHTLALSFLAVCHQAKLLSQRTEDQISVFQIQNSRTFQASILGISNGSKKLPAFRSFKTLQPLK